MICALGAGKNGPAVVVPINDESGVAKEADKEGNNEGRNGRRILNYEVL